MQQTLEVVGVFSWNAQSEHAGLVQLGEMLR